jgi:UDP-GlcNAc:undecaprenyl-phosphate GlcNAc-1-phosphate transferase
MPWLAHLGLFALAFALASGITPFVIRLCQRSNAYDLPDERKVHTRGVPRLGGVAVFAALSVGLTVAVYAVIGNFLDIAPDQSRLILVIYAGLCGFFLIGFFDDLKSVPALARLLGQFIVATVVVLLAGGTALRITSLFGGRTLPDWASIAVTVLWIVAVVNTFNWIDGLDGLASGVGLISAAAFYIIALLKPGLPNAGLTMAICVVLGGAILGFLRYNFQPAKIFIGDGGAFSLGYVLAVVSVIGLFKTAAAISFITPVAILMLPLGDTLFAILRRLMLRQPVTKPDNQHIHHRMLAYISRRYRAQLSADERGAVNDELLQGKAHRMAVLALYGFAAVFAGLAVWIGTR